MIQTLKLTGWFLYGLLNAGLIVPLVLNGSWLWPMNLFVTMYCAWRCWTFGKEQTNAK